MGFLKRLFRAAAEERSSRGAAVLMLLFRLASKPFGYLRMLMMAWFFGASAGMDAYNMVIGVSGLLSGFFVSGVQSALMPAISRCHKEDEPKARDLMGFFNLVIVLLSLFIAAVVALYPEPVMGLFAPGFSGERLAVAVSLMPLGGSFIVLSAINSGLEAWSVGTERYAMLPLLGAVSSAISLVLMVGLLYLGFGIFGAAVSMASNYFLLALLSCMALGDVPLRFKRVPWGEVKGILSALPPCWIMIGVWSLYSVVDRYFASLLSIGGITHVYYAELLFGLGAGLLCNPLMVYLSKVSRDGEEAYGISKVLSIGFAYFIPLGWSAFGAAVPAVGLLFGHGAFSPEDARVTGICAAILSVFLPFYVANESFFRLAQARGCLYRVAFVVVLSAGLNAFVDWLLYRSLGAYGLMLATASSMVLGFLVYPRVLEGRWVVGVKLRWMLPQMLLGAAWGGVLMRLSLGAEGFGSRVLCVSLSLLCAVMHLLVLDKLGFYGVLPAGWRPRELMRLLGLGRLGV
ncbi:putative membrane protein, putative virulence factor [Thermanaerovibrio velox DSM 12556]|uniref:Putative membrane protein, putative virulence factor n=1 Tax=Thermanaerovibrio velox DSM 12556 TaxID=926567 RepID=H0UMT7_9BACT|nr:lipid II flippase MurJ [Thermanaerovibrio velox]EHM09232.1 putative membrane protein, putative virulence factor [Thermanaerovibrio velox DSM 12556]